MISPEILRSYTLFTNQNDEMFKQIAMLAEEKDVRADCQLFFEGEAANELYLVREGAVVLTMNIGKRGYQIIEELEPLGKGCVIGWSSVVKPYIYRMGAYAVKDTCLIVFDGRKLRCLFGKNPSFGYYFMQQIAEVIGERLVSKCMRVMNLTV